MRFWFTRDGYNIKLHIPITLIWVIVWLCAGTPWMLAWNAWSIALIVCAVLDIVAQRMHEDD